MMATGIIVLILVVICIYSARSYIKKLAHGCCGAGGDDVKKVKVSDKDPSHYPYRAVLGVDGMTCSNCKLRVENALNGMEGVWAEVNLQKQQAVVHMKQEIPEEELRRSVNSAGYLMISYVKEA